MKTVALLAALLIALGVSDHAGAQSIRKDYREMTSAEKQAYVNALKQLYSEGVIQNFTQVHVSQATFIHKNEMFLPWHREYICRFEKELQRVNPSLSLPYWDWRQDRSTNPAWNASDFLGQFNTLWGLNRKLGAASSLPTTAQVATALALPNFSSGGITGWGFGGAQGDMNSQRQGDLETRHNNVHVWIGGTMNTMSSPTDPMFYLHHTFIDKLWQSWQGTSTFTKNALPTYPEVNPASLVDARVLKVWYASGGQVILDRYTASGQENYRYTGDIVAQNAFTIPSGTKVTFESGTKVVLSDGFIATQGTDFTAKVNTGMGSLGGASTFGGAARALAAEEADRTLEEQDDAGLADAAHPNPGALGSSDQQDVPLDYALGPSYPNPFNPTTTIAYALREEGWVTIKVYNVEGQEVATLVDGQQTAGHKTVTWDGRDSAGAQVSSGVYLYEMRAAGFRQARTMVLLK